MAYLVETIASFARAGGFVAGMFDLPEAPESLPPSFSSVLAYPPQWIGIWLAVGDVVHGRDDPMWRLVVALVLFGCRPIAMAAARPGDVGRCGADLQLYVPGRGGKTRPGLVGACPTGIGASRFSPAWLDGGGDATADARLVAMEARAHDVDRAVAALGLPVPPGAVLYRLRHGRVQAVAAVVPPGLEAIVDALLLHDEITSTFVYAALRRAQALDADCRRSHRALQLFAAHES